DGARVERAVAASSCVSCVDAARGRGGAVVETAGLRPADAGGLESPPAGGACTAARSPAGEPAVSVDPPGRDVAASVRSPCDVWDALTAPAPAFAVFVWLIGPLSP